MVRALKLVTSFIRSIPPAVWGWLSSLLAPGSNVGGRGGSPAERQPPPGSSGEGSPPTAETRSGTGFH